MAERLGGAAELERQLLGLSQSLRNRALRPGVGRATRQLAKAIKEAAPVGPTGQLKRAIGQKVFTSRRRGVMGLVGARKGFAVTIGRYKSDPTKYLHLAEGGRKAVAVRPGKALMLRGRAGGKNVRALFRAQVGPAAGRFFVRAALGSQQGVARAAIWDAVRAWLARGGT